MTLRLGSYYYALQLLSSISQPYQGAVTEVIERAQGLKKADLKEQLHKVCFVNFWCDVKLQTINRYVLIIVMKQGHVLFLYK